MGPLSRVALAVGTLGLAAGIAAGPATASPAATRSTTCTTDVWTAQRITTNFDVPAGATCRLGSGVEVTGNVTVEGELVSFGAQFDGNVSVNGGSLTAANQGIYIGGNLSITNSAGADGNNATIQSTNGFANDAGTSVIAGNFSYTYNSGRLYVGLNGGPTGTVVKGNFSYANNTGPAPDLSGLTPTA